MLKFCEFGGWLPGPGKRPSAAEARFTRVHYKGRVPHISLVFREMWDTTDVDRSVHRATRELEVWCSGIPHLAKKPARCGAPGLGLGEGPGVSFPVPQVSFVAARNLPTYNRVSSGV